jgi:FkbH-like protein
MIVDHPPFAELAEHFKGKNFRNPDILSTNECRIGNLLLIGACTTEEMPGVLGTPYDHIIYHGGLLPTLGPDKRYDLQVWQIPTRHLFNSPRFLHFPFGNEAAYEALLRDSIVRLRQSIARCAQVYRAANVPTFICNFLVPTLNPIGRLHRRSILANPQHYIAALNRELEVICSEMADAYIIDLDQIANTLGKQYFSDEFVDWFSHNSVHSLMYDDQLGRTEGRAGKRMEQTPPLGDHFDLKAPRQFHESVAAEIKAMYRAYNGADAVKMVVVDLDDTLWKGVLGDHSDRLDYSHPYMKGQLAPMAEGWPRGLAEALLYLKRRGIILGIISRNDEEIVKDRFPRIFEGELELDDFAVRLINSSEKHENMEKLLRYVNLLPGSVVFIDDNPVERARMANAFPEMRVLGRYFLWHRHLLLNAPETQIRVITEESANRSGAVAAQVEREVIRSSLTDEEFLHSLALHTQFSKLSLLETPDKIHRCVELTNKTNQWNSTGRKISAESLSAFIEGGGLVYCLSASDKYTTYGDVCFVSVQGERVVQFVMSCRVAGLGMESAALRCVMQAIGVEKLTMPFVRTEKNSPFRLYAERFALVDDAFQVSCELLDPSDHVHIDLAMAHESDQEMPKVRSGLLPEWLFQHVFAFEAGTQRSLISSRLVFERDGRIGGYEHPNEYSWRLDDGQVLIVGADGALTCKVRPVMEGHGILELAGPFLLAKDANLHLHYFRPTALRSAR